jgi:hypothetical protein
MDRKPARFAAGVIGAVLLSMFAFGTQAEGQSNRRRSTSKTTPSRTPVPVNGDPAVISRADDYPTVVIEPAPQNTDPNRVDSIKGDVGSTESIEDLRERIISLENKGKRDTDERQRRLSLNLDILTKSEQRADGLSYPGPDGSDRQRHAPGNHRTRNGHYGLASPGRAESPA